MVSKIALDFTPDCVKRILKKNKKFDAVKMQVFKSVLKLKERFKKIFF